MKKFLLGVIIGAVITIGSTAFATEISTLVGKKVSREYTVYIDGNKFESKAINVAGSSYLPVRKFSESLGYDVEFDQKGEVYLTQTIEEETIILENGSTSIITPETQKLIDRLPIINIESEIYKLNNSIKVHENELLFFGDEWERADETKTKIEIYKKQIAELELKKAELETQSTNP